MNYLRLRPFSRIVLLNILSGRSQRSNTAEGFDATNVATDIEEVYVLSGNDGKASLK
jgi:hypothetical protein